MNRVRRVAGLVREGQWSALWDKLRRRLRPPPMQALSGAKIWERLSQPVSEGTAEPVHLHIAPALGGGARDVLERHLLSERSRGEMSVVLTLDALTGGMVVELHGAGGTSAEELPQNAAGYTTGRERYRLLDDLFEHRDWAAKCVRSIRLNSLVGFRDPEQLMASVAALSRDFAVPLTVEWHDHLLTCPRHMLLNEEGTYCAIPDVNACRRCLLSQPSSLPPGAAGGDIDNWRSQSGELLRSAAQVHVFSSASRDIIARSFGDEHGFKLFEQPHAMDYFTSAPVVIDQPADLHIGVIGRIGAHKGAQEVAALADEIKRLGDSARITVIGTLEARADKSVVQVGGVYRTEDLPRLIESTGINVILLPSICPETFSFVAHEVMAMHLPLLSFAIGAQGDAAAAYAKGKAIALCPGGELLAPLKQLFLECYPSPEPAHG